MKSLLPFGRWKTTGYFYAQDRFFKRDLLADKSYIYYLLRQVHDAYKNMVLIKLGIMVSHGFLMMTKCHH